MKRTGSFLSVFFWSENKKQRVDNVDGAPPPSVVVPPPSVVVPPPDAAAVLQEVNGQVDNAVGEPHSGAVVVFDIGSDAGRQRGDDDGGAVASAAPSGGENQVNENEFKKRRLLRAFRHNNFEAVGRYRAAKHNYMKKCEDRFRESYHDTLVIRDVSDDCEHFEQMLLASAMRHGEEFTHDLKMLRWADNVPYMKVMRDEQHYYPWCIVPRTHVYSSICILSTFWGNICRDFTYLQTFNALVCFIGFIIRCVIGPVKQHDNPASYQISTCLLWLCLYALINLIVVFLKCLYEAFYPECYQEDGPERKERIAKINSVVQRLQS